MTSTSTSTYHRFVLILILTLSNAWFHPLSLEHVLTLTYPRAQALERIPSPSISPSRPHALSLILSPTHPYQYHPSLL